jgi:hypothetical protein
MGNLRQLTSLSKKLSAARVAFLSPWQAVKDSAAQAAIVEKASHRINAVGQNKR